MRERRRVNLWEKEKFERKKECGRYSTKDSRGELVLVPKLDLFKKKRNCQPGRK